MKVMKIFKYEESIITGISGYVGLHTAAELLKNGLTSLFDLPCSITKHG